MVVCYYLLLSSIVVVVVVANIQVCVVKFSRESELASKEELE